MDFIGRIDELIVRVEPFVETIEDDGDEKSAPNLTRVSSLPQKSKVFDASSFDFGIDSSLANIFANFTAGEAGRITRTKSLDFVFGETRLNEHIKGNNGGASIRDTPFAIKSIDTKDNGSLGVINDFNDNELMYIMGGSDIEQTRTIELTGTNYRRVGEREPVIDLKDCQLSKATHIMPILCGDSIIIINTHEQKLDAGKDDSKKDTEVSVDTGARDGDGKGGLGYNVYDLKSNEWLFKGGLNNEIIDFQQQFNSSHARALMFNQTYLVVSYAEYLYVYMFAYLKKPKLVETFNLARDYGLPSYTQHGMLCIEKNNDDVKILIFGGRDTGFVQSISEVILCLDNKGIRIRAARKLDIVNEVKMTDDRAVDNFCFHCIFNKSHERMVVILNGSSENKDIICFNYDTNTLCFRKGDLIPIQWTFATNASSIICRNSNQIDLLYLYAHYKISLDVIRKYVDGTITVPE